MDLKQELKELIIEDLNIAEMESSEIVDSEPLFGDEGLALDSLDAVELVVILKKKYSVDLQDMEVAKKAFASIDALADFIEKNRS